ncbi:MAG TPA: WecB/TagA/CpsF family glycosyltransferase [Bacteroidota bacterium]|nr:WecB/TagA/CpsF family glycosyltransferase [Bacteroidota bacterium]
MSLSASPESTANAALWRDVPSANILGVRIHNISLSETLGALEEMALSGRPHHVMTVNPEFIMIAQENREFRDVLSRTALSLPDGIGVLLAARIFGSPLKERVAGVDTVRQFARIAAERNIRIFLLGAAPGVAEEVARRLQAENPGLQIAGTYAGSPDSKEEEEICRKIEAARPHVLLVAYGPPRQDLWIARTADRLKIPVAIGVGGTFDFIAGVVTRAPVWMQKSGLEWLFRLAQEPSRWRRMLTLPRFALAVLNKRILGSHGR